MLIHTVYVYRYCTPALRHWVNHECLWYNQLINQLVECNTWPETLNLCTMCIHTYMGTWMYACNTLQKLCNSCEMPVRPFCSMMRSSSHIGPCFGHMILPEGWTHPFHLTTPPLHPLLLLHAKSWCFLSRSKNQLQLENQQIQLHMYITTSCTWLHWKVTCISFVKF